MVHYKELCLAIMGHKEIANGVNWDKTEKHHDRCDENSNLCDTDTVSNLSNFPTHRKRNAENWIFGTCVRTLMTLWEVTDTILISLLPRKFRYSNEALFYQSCIITVIGS